MSAKSPDAFRTISEVADWLDRPAHVLRFWESKFTQIKPVKRAGGRRYYRPEDMLLLGGIKKLLHDDGLTIKGVQKMLRENGVRHVSALSQPLDDPALALLIEAGEAAAGRADPAQPDQATAPVPPDAVVATADQTPAMAPVPEAAAPQAPAPVQSPAPVQTDDAPQAPTVAAVAADPAPTPSAQADTTTAPPAPARPALGAGLPPPPDLAAITPTPGPLSLIAAWQGPVGPAARARVTALLPQLDALIARLSTAARR